MLLLCLAGCKHEEKPEIELKKIENTLNPQVKNTDQKDSVYIKRTKQLYNEFLVNKDLDISIDSIQRLTEKIRTTYKNVEKKEIDFAYRLYKDMWAFYEDMGEHSNAITYMEEFISISYANNAMDPELLMEAYSYLVNQLLYTGQCEKAVETVFSPALKMIDDGLINEPSKEKIEFFLVSQMNLQTPYLLCARHMGDGDLQRKILKDSEKLVSQVHDSIPKFNLYKADLLGMMTSTYIRMGDLPKAKIFLQLYEKYMVPVDIIDDILLSFRKLYFYSIAKEEEDFYQELNVFNRLYAAALRQFSPNTEEYALAIGNRATVLETQGYLHENLNPEDPKIPVIYHSLLNFINGMAYDTHMNPLNAYDGLLTFYGRKKQKDSIDFYLPKYVSKAKQLNSLKDIKNAKVYSMQRYLLENDHRSADSLLQSYLKALNIENLENFLLKDDASENLLADTQTIRRLIKIAVIFNDHSSSHREFLQARSNQLYILAAKMLNTFKSNQGFSPNEIDLLKEINEGILSTRQASLKNDATIIKILEANQSLEMLQKNANRDIAISQNDDLKELISKRNKLTRNIHKVIEQQQNDEDVTDVTENEMYLTLINSRDSLNSLIKRDYPKYVFYTSPDFNLDKYRSRLDTDDVVVRFYLTDSTCYAYLISPNVLKYHKLGSRGLINDLVSDFTSKIRTQDDLTSSIASLTEFLDPVLDSMEHKKNIKIIPHEELNFVPFEVLFSNFSVGNKNLSYNSSLALDVERPQTTTGSSIAAYAPEYSFKNTTESNVIANIERSGTYNLPHAFDEATFIAQLFKGSIFGKGMATKEHFMEHATNYSLLHLAMHATVTDTSSNSEAMLLFSGDNIDDYLSIKEIYDLNLSSELTTLSACSTAYGTIDPVEGVLSLSRAFQYAGSRSTLTSLWRVPDEQTAMIMKDFYLNLKDGQSKSEALKNSKQNYLKLTDDPNLKHPYYWAGFVLTGDTSAIESASDRWLWIGAILGFLTLIGITIFLMRRRRKS